jgi:hypothetical protein
VAASTSQARMGIKRGKGSAPAVHATEKAGERLQSKVSSPIFFSILPFLIIILEINLVKHFF